VRWLAWRCVPSGSLLIVVVLVGLLAVWDLFVAIDNPDPDPECGSTLLKRVAMQFPRGRYGGCVRRRVRSRCSVRPWGGGEEALS
jgi:hypothetical protein